MRRSEGTGPELMNDPGFLEVIGPAVLHLPGDDPAAAHGGGDLYRWNGNEQLVLQLRLAALNLADTQAQPVDVRLEDRGDAAHFFHVRVQGAPAHDVIDEGAVDLGLARQLPGGDAKLPAAGLQSVREGVNHGHIQLLELTGLKRIDSPLSRG